MSSLPPAAQRPPVRANERFQAHAANLIGHDTEAIFTYLYRATLVSDSEQAATEVLRRKIPRLMPTSRVRSVFGLPWGDFGWLTQSEMAGIGYTGGDIVPDLVTSNTRRSGGTGSGC